MRYLTFNLFAQRAIALQANHPRQAHGGFAAAFLRLLVDKQMTVMGERQRHGLLTDMLFHLNGVQLVVLCTFGNVRQCKNARSQQSTAL
ncbi:hypothetical protein D3C80_1559960 [compost metagenome]